MQLTTPTAKQMRWVTKTTNQFIKMYENGQWNTLMKTFKTNGSTVATEATIDVKIDTRANIAKDVSEIPGKISNAFSAVKTAVNKIPAAGKVIVAMIGLFIVARVLKMKEKDYLLYLIIQH